MILEYLHIWDLTRQIQLVESQPDKICWKWTSDKLFSTSSAYKSFLIGQHPIKGAKVLRKTHAPPKCKFFVWLVLHHRCWMAEQRKRHGLQDDDTCALCNQSPGTIEHLLVTCSFSRDIWFKSLRRLGWEASTPTAQSGSLADWWNIERKSIPKDGRTCFDSLIVLICWLLWKERNDRTFDRRVGTIQDVLWLRMSLAFGTKQGSNRLSEQ